MEPGWIDERVEMSDWLEPVGEVGNGSTWAEVSALLTFLEVPGIYFQTDTGLLRVLDHVTVTVGETQADYSLELRNDTDFPAAVKLFYERSTDRTRVLGYAPWRAYRTIHLPARRQRTVTLRKDDSVWREDKRPKACEQSNDGCGGE